MYPRRHAFRRKARHVDSKVETKIEESLVKTFKSVEKRMIFLDYDGTLVGYNEKPELATPDESLMQLLKKLIEFPQTEVTSGLTSLIILGHSNN